MPKLMLLLIDSLRCAKKKGRGVCRHRIEALRFALESGEDISAIRVNRMEDGTYAVKDGRHRVAAHKAAGMTQIWAIVENIMRWLQQLRALCSRPTLGGFFFMSE